MFQSLRSVLAIPAAYNLWWNVVGGPGFAKVLVREYLQPRVGARILEIGCGPGTIVGYLPRVEYLGFDLSSKYIEAARKRFPRAQFVCERVRGFSLAKHQSFDAVLALGILHHLDDQEAKQLFQIAHDALKSGGKLITLDGVWTSDQSGTARWLLARDR
jgi:SAM-dependent methyltransferase